MRRFLLGFIVFITLFSSLSAADNPRAVIIFDASGSMWGQINGKTKIEIAKETLEKVVNEWNPDVSLGLTVYGHRTKGDCNDIETVIPVGKVDKNKTLSIIKGIQPKGKTPIARSLKKVADEIKYTEEKATIILISDGKESCDSDPCGTAKALEKEGIDFVTHVIGFNVDKTTDKELACIASVTGGEYFSPKDATALNEAMKVIAKKVEKVTAKPVPKPVVKKLENTFEVSASEAKGGKWIRANHGVFVDEEGKAGQRLSSPNSYKKEVGKSQLPVGKYILKSRYNEFKKETPFAIKAGEVTQLHIVMGQTGNVEVSASEAEGGKWIRANHGAFVDEEGKAGQRLSSPNSYKKKVGKSQLPVGKYILRSRYNEFKKETPFAIKAGEVTQLHIVMGQTGNVEVSASEAEGGKWIRANHGAFVDEEGKAGQRLSSPNSYKKKVGKSQLPVGKYILRSRYNEFKKETPFVIKAGEVTKLHIIFSQFFIESKCSDEGANVSYEIYAGNGRLVYEKKLKCSKTLKVTLDNGDYTVEVNTGSGTKSMKFFVGAKHPNKITIDLQSLNHEEEIREDSQTPSSDEPQKELEKITQVLNQIGGISPKDVENIKDIGALGGSVQGSTSKEQHAKTEDDKTEDKAFDDMGKELEMFTK